MKTLRVSDATYHAIAGLALLPFRSTAVRQPDGTWLVPVEDETYDRLQQSCLPGESDDDALQRLIHHYRGKPLN